MNSSDTRYLSSRPIGLIRPILFLTVVHFTVALCYQIQWRAHGGAVGADAWDFFWQTIPTEDLLHRPWQSLWYLHAQPPLYSLWGFLWLVLTGSKHFVNVLLWFNIVPGILVTLMTWDLTRALTENKKWAFAAGLLMAVNPALVSYETYALYELPVIFFLTTSAWTLGRSLSEKKYGALMLFVLSLNLLVLTRSMYHLIFVIGAMLFILPQLKKVPRIQRWTLLCIALLPTIAWYGKNAAHYGFFGPSSWFGLGFYQCIHRGTSEKEFERLFIKGELSEMLYYYHPYYYPPKEFTRYGFDVRSDVPLLSREDLHNINIPAVSKEYARHTVRLVFTHPLMYLRAFHKSYMYFCLPPSLNPYLESPDAPTQLPWEMLFTQVLYGRWVTTQLEFWLRADLGSLFYVYFPLLLAGGFMWIRRLRRTRHLSLSERDTPQSSITHHREHAQRVVMGYFLFVCIYVLIVSCSFECGENHRFRFATEPFTLIIAVTLLQSILPRMWRWLHTMVSR